jgi:hypothetical protein
MLFYRRFGLTQDSKRQPREFANFLLKMSECKFGSPSINGVAACLYLQDPQAANEISP